MANTIALGVPGDYHVHLRDGMMKETVTPLVKAGGAGIVYVMPNLIPPLTDVDRVLEYKKSLEILSPDTTFLMSLYLSPQITPEVIKEAKARGVTGVKCYPAGVTTNSDHGVSSYEPFYPTFAEMEKQNMVLNLHGECPSGHSTTVLNAEEQFLPMLKNLHEKFPKLRIILEHCTSKAAVETVKSCGPTVAATITAHHLYLTIDQWAGNSFNFCKPVAKHPEDRDALIEAATSGNSKFFFGSDSAPHPFSAKNKAKGYAAGVFTQSHAIPYVADVFEKAGALDKLKDFVTTFGYEFYGKPELKTKETVTLVKQDNVVPDSFGANKDETYVVPFLAGENLGWKVTWN